MANFTFTASATSATENDIVVLTVTSDSLFKDSVEFFGMTNNGSTFNIVPGAVFLCHDDQETADVTIQYVPTVDELKITATGGGISQQLKIDLLPPNP